MLRVYALYNRNRRVAAFLAIAFFVDVISLSVHSYLCIKACVFDQACFMRKTPPPALGFSIEMLVVQGTLWGMAWWKNNKSEVWTRTPLIGLIVRDGAFIFVGTFAVLVIALPYALLVKSVGHIIFSWFISLLAFAACRLTINLLRLNTPEASTQNDFELSSFIEIPLDD
ncbi:hypothetical protein BD779DRAFT_419728 [Infundibulicybe gibba]|nr:hypothetical protein BD779DRAFT_419728 [Infundibulicybe gibba]